MLVLARARPHIPQAMLGYALIDGFTDLGEGLAAQRLVKAVAGARGVIVDFAFVRDEALRLTVELEAGALPRLGAALEAAGVHLLPASLRTLEAARSVSPGRPVTALLHVTLVAEDLAETA